MPNLSKIMAILALGVLGAAYLIARPDGPFAGPDVSGASSNLVLAQPVAPSSSTSPVPPTESRAPDADYAEAPEQPEDAPEDNPPEDTVIEAEPEALPVPDVDQSGAPAA